MRASKKFFANINLQNLFFTILGSAIVALGTSIHVDSGAVDGGIIGISILIENITNGQVEIWLSSLLINAFFYLLAWRLTDAQFIFNMGAGTLTYSLFVRILDPVVFDLSEYILLATFLGMLLIEFGSGLMLRYGSSPNGEHVLSMAIVKKGGFDFGWFSFIKDVLIILLFLPFTDTDIENVIFSLIFMTITTPIMSYVISAPRKSGFKQSIVKKKKKWISILIIGLVIIIILSAIAIYLNNFYEADTKEIYSYSTNYIHNVETKRLSSEITAYVPSGEIKAGFVFYPGGKVEVESYEPLLKACAEQGIICIAIKMPQNLAIFGINKGVDAIKRFPEVTDWYIGGHSLGGSMAAACASNNEDIFKGVILLAAYSTNDITNLDVLSIYGDRDNVLTKSKYNDNKENLPNDFTEFVISGGNHAYFGMYGEQTGDGKASITNVEQINATAQKIVEFIVK